MLPIISFLSVLISTIFFCISHINAHELETYIVHLNPRKGLEFAQPQDLEAWYCSFLPTSNMGGDEKPCMVYTYHNVLTGFAAKLSAGQAKAMKRKKGFVSARPQKVYQLQTTHTPKFLGLQRHSGLWRRSNYGKGIIIGVLDTGVTPGHPSFDDQGIPPPPARWKGKCEVAGCNNKLIGMRNFLSSSPAYDKRGHGSHTSSIAAGNFVKGAEVLGNANGTAVGIAPLAHLAMYRVCGLVCNEGKFLAAMDAAVADGVDVISLSIGNTTFTPFYDDGLMIGAFAAVKKGIFVSCAAGNKGPESATLSNEAPWVLTVGASTIDRRIAATVYLGNKEFLAGESLFQPKNFSRELLPLVYPGINGDKAAAICMEGSLDHLDVKGKVVLCDAALDITQGQVVKDAGGAAMIVINPAIVGDTTFAEAHVLPVSQVCYKDGVMIKEYMNSTSFPLATIIFNGTTFDAYSAPQVPYYSSRGPNRASPGIVKPDIIGPGHNILAAWHVSIDHKTQTKATFNVDSGTSMSCPHLAGIAALIKRSHPDWSPAAIKSAIMTTASQVSLNGHAITDERELPADIFSIGAGHVNPSKANDPGLVFDIQPDDYIPYLCGLGYTSKQVGMIVNKRVSCSRIIPEPQLNYPSFAISLASGDRKTYTRTVTNVGDVNSTYKLLDTDVSVPKGLILQVSPVELRFTELNQKLTYEVSFIRENEYEVKTLYAEGSMTWSSGKYSVRTPFSVKFI